MNFSQVCLRTTAALLVLSPLLTPAQAAEEASSLSFNVGAVSDYRYRGITQTRFGATAQGGADYAHASGLYVGAWASGVRWIKDAGASAGDVELDLYGGYKGALAGGLGYDVGVLRYQYPGNTLADLAPAAANANTTEVYGALSYGVATLKYAYALTNLFGFVDSAGSSYVDLSATLDLGNGYSVVPHVGRQEIVNNTAFSYTDYALTLNKDFGNGLSASLAAVGTNADQALYVTPAGDFSGRSGAVLGLKYSF